METEVITKVVATGIDVDGNPITFEEPHHFVSAFCANSSLKELTIKNGIGNVNCNGNNLSKLDVPESVVFLTCDKELFDYDTCRTYGVAIIYK